MGGAARLTLRRGRLGGARAWVGALETTVGVEMRAFLDVWGVVGAFMMELRIFWKARVLMEVVGFPPLSDHAGLWVAGIKVTGLTRFSRVVVPVKIVVLAGEGWPL